MVGTAVIGRLSIVVRFTSGLVSEIARDLLKITSADTAALIFLDAEEGSVGLFKSVKVVTPDLDIGSQMLFVPSIDRRS